MKRNLIKVITINESEGFNINSMTNVDRKQYFEDNCLSNDTDTIIEHCKKYLKTLQFIEDNKDLETWAFIKFHKNQNHWLLEQDPAEMLIVKNKLFDSIINDIHFDNKDKENEFNRHNKISESYSEYENLHDDWGENVWLMGFISDMIKDFIFGLKVSNLVLNA